MLNYAFRRMLATLPVIVVVAFVVFSLLYVTPGDPAAVMAGDNATPADIARIHAEMGLDEGYIPRFLKWSLQILQGNLGVSLYTGLPVTHLIAQRLLPTLSLLVGTLLLAVIVAIPLGAAAAARQGSLFDRLAMLVSVLGFSVAAFVVGYVLAYNFGLKLRWLPIQGFSPPSDGWGKYFASLVLPSVSLSFLYIALISRITRSAMLDVMSQDYIRTARAKGVSEFMVIFVHALKNAAVPISTVIGLGFASLIGGAVVIETVFALPGLGLLMVNSILSRDYPVIQGVLLMFSMGYVLVNLAVDLLYAVFDPRIRY
jgi:peptide/nickel transport system permease protein